jgi:iron(III) transport system substrate-binding protein
VVLYSSLNLDDVKDVFPRFEAQFPGIKIHHVRATGERLLDRLVNESVDGHVRADVLETSGFEVYRAIKKGLIESYCPPNVAELDPQLYDSGCQWIGVRTNHDVIAWNTSLVAPHEAPTSYQDLRDPRWKGKIIMDSSDVEMFAALLSDEAYGAERGMELFRDIAANEPQLNGGRGEAAEMLAAGRGAVLVGAYAHRIEQLKASGAPVEWMKTEGVLYMQAVAKVKDGPNPNAGKLFLTWLVSIDGQEALADLAGRYTLHPKVTRAPYAVPDGFKAYASRPEGGEVLPTRQRQWRQLFGS